MKIICPNCQKVIDVEGKKETVKCPHCENEVSVETGLKLEARTYAYLSSLAYQQMNSGLHDKAIENYEKALVLRPNDLASICGICLTHLYSGTYVEPHFELIPPIFDHYEIVLDKNNSLILLSFIEDVLNHSDIYLDLIDKRLIKNNLFLSYKYKNAYYNGLESHKNLLEFLKSCLDLTTTDELKIYNEDDALLNRINKNISLVEEKINKTISVQEKDEELEDERIVKISGGPVNGSKKLTILAVFLLLLTIVFLVLGLTLKNNVFFYIAIAPFVLGAAAGVYSIYIKKKSGN